MSIRLAFLAANPIDTDRLRLDREFREIGERLRQGKTGRKIALSSHWAVRPEDLAGVLLRVRPHIIHFSGHGTPAGIVLESPTGNAVLAPGSALAELFRIVSKDAQCVVLNACYSDSHAEAIARHVDVVVGTTRAITDEGAIRFAAGFYQAVSFGRDLNTAFELGVNEVQLHNLPDGQTPRLVAAPQVDPSKRVVRGDKRRAVIAVATATVAALSILAGILLIRDRRDTSLHNVALAVDGSASMVEPLRDDIKLGVAVREVENYVRPLSDTSLALRFFGGVCSTAPPSEPDVGFNTHNGGEVAAAARGREPFGAINLVDTVLAAIDDFSDPELYPEGIDADQLINRVVVITGGRDGCQRDTERLAQRALQHEVELEFTFIGLGIDDAESVTYVDELATAVEGDALFADSAAELRSILDALLADDFRGATNTMTESIINPVGHAITDAANAYLDAAQPEDADLGATITQVRDLIKTGRDALDDTEHLFQALRRSNGPNDYRELWEIDLAQRELQSAQLDRLDRLMELLEEGKGYLDPGSDAQATWSEYELAREQYVEKNDEFEELQHEFLDSLVSS